MTAIGRRAFLSKAGAGGLALIGLPPAKRVLGPACTPGPPIPRTIQQAIRGRVFTRGQPGFAGAAHVYNMLYDGVLPR